jgi:VWFA-related protein
LALAPLPLGKAQTQQPATENPAAQTAGGEPEATFRTNANLVLVDVVVRDKGKPIEGLKASDFHLLEDGHEQKVTVFEEHKATDAGESNKSVELPPHMYSNYPRFKLTSAANVLLLDSLNTQQQQQNWLRQRLDKYLGGVPQGTQIALFTLASKLQMVTGFTTDAKTIEAALSGAQTQPQKTGAMDTTFDQTTQSMNTQIVQNSEDMDNANAGSESNNQAPAAGLSVAQRMQDFETEAHGLEMDTRVRFTLAALEELGRYLSTIPGRKNLIWFSGAFPITFSANPTGNDLNSASGLDLDQYRSYEGEVRKIGAIFARGRVAVYPVDARGSMTLPNANIVNAQPQAEIGMAADMQAATGDAVQNDITVPQQWGAEHITMEEIARDTGGEAFVESNGAGNAVGKAVVKAIEDGSNYYTLGYVPADRNYNGDYRKIEVKLEAGHYALEYRRGYIADDPNKPTAAEMPNLSPMTAAMVYGAPPLSEIMFDVRVLPAGDPALAQTKPSPQPAGQLAKAMKGPVRREMVDFWIDPRNVNYRTLPNGDRQLELEVTQAVYEADGHRVNFSDLGAEMDLTPAQEAETRQRGLQIHQEIDVPATRTWLRLGVEDKLSGRIGTLEIPLAAETKQIAAQR